MTSSLFESGFSTVASTSFCFSRSLNIESIIELIPIILGLFSSIEGFGQLSVDVGPKMESKTFDTGFLGWVTNDFLDAWGFAVDDHDPRPDPTGFDVGFGFDDVPLLKSEI